MKKLPADPFAEIFEELAQEATAKAQEVADELTRESLKTVIRLGDSFFNPPRPNKKRGK